jgi:hypothetical protein
MDIDVVLDPNCEALVRRLGLSPERIGTTVNQRDVGVADDNFTRMVTLKEFPDGQILMVDADIIRKAEAAVPGTVTPDGECEIVTQVQQVKACLAIDLRRVLPAGPFGRSTDMETVLALVAESFGYPVRCHPDEPLSTLYGGPWDGKDVQVERVGPGETVALRGTFSAAELNCELVYALNLDKYLRWRDQGVQREGGG